MYWFTLIAGILIIVMQLYKYWTGVLELKLEEGIVTACAIAMMRNPNIISDFVKSKINKDEPKN